MKTKAVVEWAQFELAEGGHRGRSPPRSPVCHEYFKGMVAVDHGDPSVGVLHFEQVESYA